MKKSKVRHIKETYRTAEHLISGHIYRHIMDLVRGIEGEWIEIRRLKKKVNRILRKKK